MNHPRIAHHPVSNRVDLWPCPPPVWKWTGPSKLSPKRRRRKKHLAYRNQVVQMIVCVLNWETLGHPVAPPPQARVGYGYSEAQVDMLGRLERLVDFFLAAGDFDAGSLGRSVEKLDALLSVCRELLVSGQDVDLTELAAEVGAALDPYSNKHACSSSPRDESMAPPSGLVSDDLFAGKSLLSSNAHQGSQGSPSGVKPHKVISNGSGCTAKPVVADRIKWEHSPSFDPTPFLVDPIVRQGYINPETLRLPAELWERAPPGKVHCTRSEVLRLAEKWDSKDACMIFPCSEVAHEEAVGIFAVGKDQSHDRLILNPVVINARMKHYSNYTKSLAPGSLISLIQLDDSELLRISADDLSEMYYTFQVSLQRARRNCLRMKFMPDEIKHFKCFNPSLHSGPCYLALAALAMGDSLAVEVAQQAHFQVLSQVWLYAQSRAGSL